MYSSLRDFLSALDRAGELRRISAGVSPMLEISAIADRESKSPCAHAPSAAAQWVDPRCHDRGGHALLFENVEGSDIPVLINAWGSYRRMEMALGCADGAAGAAKSRWGGPGFEAIGARIAELVRPQPPRSLREAFSRLRQLAPLLRIPPRRIRGDGECQQVVHTATRIDLRRLPLIKCWPLDGDLAAVGWPESINDRVEDIDISEEFRRAFGGRYITLGGVHTIHARDKGVPKPASHNIGMYRVQLLGTHTMAMHWHIHHDGAAHWRSWKARGESMPVAIVLGGESVLPYAATCPLPPGLSELLMAGFLNGRGIPLCKCKTVPLWVPANAEIIIEGHVSHEARAIGYDPARDGPLGPGEVVEGPFGDHTGFYSLPDRYPILRVTAITHRRDPIYPTTIVGLPPQEDYYLGKATERIMLPLLRTILPDIEDYHLPLFGAFHNAAFIKIDKQYDMHARRVMHGVWGAGQMSWTKNVFVVNKDVNVHDRAEVLKAVARRCRPGTDTETVHGPLDILDHAAPFLGAGPKMGFDATGADSNSGCHGQDRSAGHDHVGVQPEASVNRYVSAIKRLPGVRDAEIPDELGKGWMFVWLAPGTRAKDVIESIWRIEVPNGLVPPPYVILLDDVPEARSIDGALFFWVANMSPERDSVLSPDGSRIAFDSTAKEPGPAPGNGRWPVRPFPPVMRMDEATKALVEQRWAEYGFE